MNSKRIVTGLFAAVVSLALISTTPTAAAADPSPLAYEEKQAQDATWNDTPKACRPDPSTVGVKGCIQPYGDVTWVLDRWADGYGVSLRWWEYTRLAGNLWVETGRNGKCINNRGQAVGWTTCNWGFTEGNALEWSVQYWDQTRGWVHVGTWFTEI